MTKKRQVQSSIEQNLGYSKTLFQCPLCSRMVHAHELINDINGLPVRDARLFCEKCKKKFNTMSLSERAEFLRQRFEEHYGDSQFIYALNDPNTGARRYIGRASNPQHRYNIHLQKARQQKPTTLPPTQWGKVYSSKDWIADLIKTGQRPVLEILEAVHPPVRVCEREMRWISQSIKEGYDLFNAENSSDD